jgi:hypothetical protein
MLAVPDEQDPQDQAERSDRIAAGIFAVVFALLVFMVAMFFRTSERDSRLLSVICWIAAGGTAVFYLLAWLLTPRRS